MRDREQHPDSLKSQQMRDYTSVSSVIAAQMLHRYSTSFGMASRLLPARTRSHVSNIYALVRLADELVDGVAAEAGLSVEAIRAEIKELQAETLRAMDRGFSTNIVVHAFATTARMFAISSELVNPFFESMCRDTDPTALAADEVGPYIYGSAEVVGLMCLAVFCRGVADGELIRGARSLGSAFQKVNFLRDLRADVADLDRNYFPWLDPRALSDADVSHVVADIAAELDYAATQIPRLPRDCQGAVWACHDLFAELNTTIARTPAETLMTARIRVSNVRKLALVAGAYGKVLAPLLRRKASA